MGNELAAQQSQYEAAQFQKDNEALDSNHDGDIQDFEKQPEQFMEFEKQIESSEKELVDPTKLSLICDN